MSEMDEPIRAIVHIRRNSDGIVRSHPTDWYGPYMWELGNYSCDCNRYLFFQRAAGEPDDEAECGDGKYSVEIVNDAGTILQRDDNW